MSWDSYVETSLVGSGHVTLGALAGLDGSIWAQTKGMNLKTDEVNMMIKGFEDPDSLYSTGIKVGGIKYIFLGGGDFLKGKKGQDGVIVYKANKALVIGVYKDGIQTGNCSSVCVKKHFVFLVNGFGGHHSGMFGLQKELTKRSKAYPQVEASIYVTKLNDGLKSFFGIDRSGQRVAQEIMDHVGQATDFSFSIVGHSMGGVISRYALGVLDESKWFDKKNVALENYMAICSPHLGARNLNDKKKIGKIFNLVAPKLGRSCNQFVLGDQKENLFMNLTKPKFLSPLSKFQKRIIYGNIKYDWRVPFETALILPQCKQIEEFKNSFGKNQRLPRIYSGRHLKKISKVFNFDPKNFDFEKYWFTQSEKQKQLITMTKKLNTLSWVRHALLPPDGNFFYRFNQHSFQTVKNIFHKSYYQTYLQYFTQPFKF
ncbi:alpha/beta-hydrolases superfamily protein [Anaeramoeba flamelloides]|uniref:Profilin n=1 Tax=Anaeramoeba flamelloides TaxID=1746091 RepID=A0ABQ8Y3M1_9EUKA|nr:alpha/beta-hydrolases superfamily protein [Anaeramoeba flamelloides]